MSSRVQVFGAAEGYYLTETGGEPLVCTACGERIALEEVFTTDGVTTRHQSPSCDPDWKRDQRPCLFRRLWPR